MLDFKKFRRLRRQAGIAGSEIVRGAGIDCSRLSLWEAGAVNLTDVQITALEESLTAAIWGRIHQLTKVARLIVGGAS